MIVNFIHKPDFTAMNPKRVSLITGLKALFLLFFTGWALPATSATILVWGDSLSAAYGMRVEQGWVAQLQSRLGENWTVINGSVSGETTAGGLTRLPQALLTHQPDILIIGLGSNDGLRGQSLKQIKANLLAMIAAAKAQKILLLGHRIPPNYGASYANGFAGVFEAVAESENVALVPFLLEGVAADLDMMQADTLHPKPAAQLRLLDNVWPYLEPLLQD